MNFYRTAFSADLPLDYLKGRVERAIEESREKMFNLMRCFQEAEDIAKIVYLKELSEEGIEVGDEISITTGDGDITGIFEGFDNEQYKWRFPASDVIEYGLPCIILRKFTSKGKPCKVPSRYVNVLPSDIKKLKM